MAITLLAQINGAEGWDDIADFGEAREAWLRSFMELPAGIPSADTFRRVFEAIDTRTFGQCLAELMAELAQDLAGRVVAIDGKTLRGSFDRRLDPRKSGRPARLHLRCLSLPPAT